MSGDDEHKTKAHNSAALTFVIPFRIKIDFLYLILFQLDQKMIGIKLPFLNLDKKNRGILLK